MEELGKKSSQEMLGLFVPKIQLAYAMLTLKKSVGSL